MKKILFLFVLLIFFGCVGSNNEPWKRIEVTKEDALLKGRPTVVPTPEPTPIPEAMIPNALQTAVDDTCWLSGWVPENSREENIGDYETIRNVGQTVGSRILTVAIVQNLDMGNVCGDPNNNAPNAPANMTEEGLAWNNELIGPYQTNVMNFYKDNANFVEFGIHGICHGHFGATRKTIGEAEYGHVYGWAKRFRSDPWISEDSQVLDTTIHLSAFEDIIRQYWDIETCSYPETMVAPAHAWYYGIDGNGSVKSTGSVAAQFGVKYMNNNIEVSVNQYWPKVNESGTVGTHFFDSGILCMDRIEGCNYNWEGCTPWYGDWNEFSYPDYPDENYSWIESHFPNWWGGEAGWITYLSGINNAPDRMLARNTEQCASQFIYRNYATITGNNGAFIIDTNNIPSIAYVNNLLGNLTVKIKVDGQHIQSATINNNAQIVGYYEDSFGYAYLIIGSAEPMGRLLPGVYTLNTQIGTSTMPSYVDLTLATFNIYSMTNTLNTSILSVKVYGNQNIKVKFPFTPTQVVSNNPNLFVNFYSINGSFITINVIGKNIQGESGIITIM